MYDWWNEEQTKYTLLILYLISVMIKQVSWQLNPQLLNLEKWPKKPFMFMGRYNIQW